jgi:hypothetical protein
MRFVNGARVIAALGFMIGVVFGVTILALMPKSPPEPNRKWYREILKELKRRND